MGEMIYTCAAWSWLILGIVLILAELVVPGFIICFFGVSAILVSILCFFFPGVAVAWQLLIFALLSVVLLIASRKCLPGIFKGNSKCTESNIDIDADDIAGAAAVVVADIEPDAPGKAEFRGTVWNAVADETIKAGTHVVVQRRDNLNLIVTANKNK